MAKKRGGKWGLTKNAKAYFRPDYDDAFKARYPVLYWLTVIATIVCVAIGPFIYAFLGSLIQPTFTLLEAIFWLFGFISSLGISVGIFNLFMIIYKLYLGHYVTLCSFAIGIVGSAIGLFFLWLI